jgi:hypothetical protein
MGTKRGMFEKTKFRKVPELRTTKCTNKDIIYKYSDWLRAGRPGFDFRQEIKIFSSLQRQDHIWGPHSVLSKGYEGSFPGSKAALRYLTYLRAL